MFAVMTGARGPAGHDRAHLTLLVLLVLVGAGLLTSPGIIVRYYIRDFMFVLDSLWRMRAGQVPHLDFPSAIGQAFYWPYALIGGVTGGTMFDVLRANLLVGGFALALSAMVLPRRLAPVPYVLAAAIVLLTATTGRSADAGVFFYDYLAPYNRWGWSFAIVATLIVALPERRRSRVGGVLDALCLGTALFLMFLLKVSFFGPMLVLAVVAMALRFLRPGVFVGAVATGLAMTALVELFFGNLGAYLADIRMAAAVNVDSGRAVRWGRVALSLLQSGLFGVAALAVIAARAPLRPARAWIATWWRPVLLLVAILVAAAAIHAQNHPRWEVAMPAIAVLVAAELAGQGASAGPLRGQGSRGRLIVALIVAATVLPLPLIDAAAIAAHNLEARMATACAAPALRGTPLDALLFPRGALLSDPGAHSGGSRCGEQLAHTPAEAPSTELAEQRRLFRLVAALRHRVRAGEMILSLDFSNPYPFVFRAPSPRGSMAWWDYGRTYSDRHHPAPEALVGQADYVIRVDYAVPAPPVTPGAANRLREMLGVLPGDEPGYGQRMWAIYGSVVKRDFRPVMVDGEISIWRRVRRDPVASERPIS
jgi:hypothetical protein